MKQALALAPLVLAGEGYDIVHSPAFSARSFLGCPLGSLCSVFVVERMERKTLISLSALTMLACRSAFGYCDDATAIVFFGQPPGHPPTKAPLPRRHPPQQIQIEPTDRESDQAARDCRRRPVHQRAHHVPAGRQQHQRHKRERDTEGQHHL